VPLHGGPISGPRLKIDVGGLTFPNPIGLAAGYDKNAEALRPLSKAGFGFLEVGAATPRPQEGNAKPRLYRLRKHRGVINRFGFNNQGIEPIRKRLERAPTNIPRGLNLGANKDSYQPANDFGYVLSKASAWIDFATVNVSSPNTKNLRDLQGKAALEDLLNRVDEANKKQDRKLPIFLKIAPDLNETEIQDIADIALNVGLSAIICTNTTVDRKNLISHHKKQSGGLSGRPLFEKSTRILAQMRSATKGQIDLIGVGGVSSAEDAYTKIQAGASAVQLYTALVYEGLSLVPKIADGLDKILVAEGIERLDKAVGVSTEKWL
jgi:dihydroorotate dehydrogenase